MLNADIKRKIDGARQILVGKVPDPKAQVEQITTALIYKFMDDMDKESVELGGKARFFTDTYEKYAWSKLMDPRLGGLERLNLYAEAITVMQRNPHIPQLFRDIFKDTFLPYRDPETLSLFLKEINVFVYDHSENLGNAFEYLLSVLGAQGDAGQFRTPRHIIDFIVELVHPTKDDKILDPACGTAGFLISAYKNILAQHDGFDTYKNKINRKPLTPDERNKMTKNFVGYDISPDMVRLSLVNLYLHGFQDPKIFEYDTLTSDEKWDETFDVILANPPFMTPKGGIRPHKRFSVQANRAEVLFVTYIMDHLNPKGRAGVIVPESVVLQGGKTYKQIRKLLVEDGLYSVISLPAGVFNPYSGVKTSILLFDKEISKRSKNIIFIKLRKEGTDLGSQRKDIDENEIPEIITFVKDYQDAVLNDKKIPTKKSDFAWVVSKDEVLKNTDISLSGDRYVDPAEHMVSEGSELIKLDGHIEEITERAKNENLEVWSVSNEFGFVPSEEFFDKKVASQNTSNYKRVPPKAFAYNPSRINVGSVAYNDSDKTGIVSPMYVVFKVIDEKEINPRSLFAVLKYADLIKFQIRHFAQGAVRAQLRFKDLQLIKIPLLSSKQQKDVVADLEKIEKLKESIENTKISIKEKFDNILR